MAHRLNDEAGVTRALAFGIRMTDAERIQGRFMRAPDHGDAPASRGDAMESFLESVVEDHLGGHDEEEQEQETSEAEEADDEQEEVEEAESEETQEETDEAPEPIDPPVSWDKDAKERFAQLPIDDQRYIAEREAQRERAIQQATTEAANAKRTAAVEANAALAETQRQYASHLEQLASQFAPQRPDPAILAQDPVAFYQLQSRYEQEVAQQHEMLQRAAQAKQEADQRENFTRQEEIATNAKALADHFGDVWTDTKQRQELLTGLEAVGAELGYPAELMGQASATDIIALAKAHEWKAKAAKYDDLQKTKMEAVRAAKGKPRVNKPGTGATSAEKSSRNRDAAWAAVKQSRGKDGDAALAFLESAGIKL